MRQRDFWEEVIQLPYLGMRTQQQKQKMLTTVLGLGLGVSLALSGGLAIAQETINADGNSGAANPGSPAVDADGPTVVYGDVNTGPGTNNIGPPISTTSGSAVNAHDATTAPSFSTSSGRPSAMTAP